MSASSQLATRDQIGDQYKWNAPSVYASDDIWHQEFAAVTADLARFDAFRGHLHEGPELLSELIGMYMDMLRRVRRLMSYANMSTNVDSTDAKAAAMYGQWTGLSGRFSAATAFIAPELIAIGLDTLKVWMGQRSDLRMLEQYLDDLFRKQEHIRSAEIEELLGMSDELFLGYRQVHSQLSNADLDFRPAHNSTGDSLVVAQSTERKLMVSPDREARRTAWESLTDEYLAHQNTLATNYLYSVRASIFKARARRFDTVLESCLFTDNIPVSVFHTLIETYRANLPVWHRYWRARRRALAVETLHPYDTWAPMTDYRLDIPYEQAVEWIAAALAPLGEEYVGALRNGCLKDRWVDVFPNVGKRQGAFSDGSHDTHPFIMMSYGNDLNGVSTLAHELGHSMHSWHSRRAQPILYSGYSLFVAEVASNFNQAMTRSYLFEQMKDDAGFQVAQVEEAMYNFHRYFFIMPTLARFEYEVHSRVEKGQGLGAKDLNNIMADLFEEAYGGEMHVDRDRVGITWGTFLHMYIPFYTYMYATGIAGAHALAGPIRAGAPGAADRYLEMLRTGSRKYAVDALKDAGVDLTTSQPVEAAFATMAGYVDTLDKHFA